MELKGSIYLFWPHLCTYHYNYIIENKFKNKLF